MSVNFKKVATLVAGAIKYSSDRSTSWNDNVRLAWEKLCRRRQEPGRSLDLDLAAAEHYMFARYLVGAGKVSEKQMIVLASIYYFKKIGDRLLGNPNAEAFTKNPVSEPDSDVVMAGVLGAKHGAVDHAAFKVREKPPLWRPISDILPNRDSIFDQAGTTPEGAAALCVLINAANKLIVHYLK